LILQGTIALFRQIPKRPLLSQGRGGDDANAVLAAVGYNFRRIFAWMKGVLCLA
jgi:hypothetical protein